MKARALAAIAAAIAVVALLPAAAAAAAGESTVDRHRANPEVVAPASSPGAAHFYRQRALVDAEIHLRGTNGFRFDVFTFDGTEFVSASKRTSHLGEESVSYFGRTRRGHPSFRDGVLAMNLGRLGRFHGRFVVKSTESHKPGADCTGVRTVEKGFFVGTFDLHGERGYSTVHTRRARGWVTRQGPVRCPAPAGHPGREARQTHAEERAEAHESELVAGDAKYRVFFQANRNDSIAPGTGRPLVSFQASVSGSRVGRLQVSYTAFLLDANAGADDAFQVPDLAGPPTEATIKPPAPFSGAGTFHLDTAKTASWTGDLAVELPGLGSVPLTGGPIQAGLCVAGSHCTKTLPEPLQQALEAPRGTASGILQPVS